MRRGYRPWTRLTSVARVIVPLWTLQSFLPLTWGLQTYDFSRLGWSPAYVGGEKGDARITCVACHDPHKPLVRNTASYDEKCLKCRANTGSSPLCNADRRMHRGE